MALIFKWTLEGFFGAGEMGAGWLQDPSVHFHIV
jgi:hypothetical protein